MSDSNLRRARSRLVSEWGPTTFEVGDRCMLCHGGFGVVVRGYGMYPVPSADGDELISGTLVSRRAGYHVQKDTGELFFYAAADVWNVDGTQRHLQRVRQAVPRQCNRRGRAKKSEVVAARKQLHEIAEGCSVRQLTNAIAFVRGMRDESSDE